MDIALSHVSLEILQGRKNLLAFSGGVDSSALFFILQEHKIPFDVAILDYARRDQSKQEVEYAKILAKQQNKICYILSLHYKDSLKMQDSQDSYSCLESRVLKSSSLYHKEYFMESQPINSNFEHQARKLRYDFFAFLIQEYHYNNLILAQHLDDKIEWFFMQFAKGAGLNSLLGFGERESRYVGNTYYSLVRPLIHIRKQELLSYNQRHAIKYFVDKSNMSFAHKRNVFRACLQNLFTQHDTEGIKHSFVYLHKEKTQLYPDSIICIDTDLLYCKRLSKNNTTCTTRQEIHSIDMMAKRLGYIMSAKQKAALEKMLALFSSDLNVITNTQPSLSSTTIKQHCTSKDCLMGDKIVIGINIKFLFVGICAHWRLNQIKQSLEIKEKIEHSLMINKDSESQNSQYALWRTLLDSGLHIPKKQREVYRKAHIPHKIRAIMYLNSIYKDYIPYTLTIL